MNKMKELINDFKVSGLAQVFIGKHVSIVAFRDYFNIGVTIEYHTSLVLHLGVVSIEIY